MTYSAQELSAEAGAPIELYDFRIGTDVYTLTSSPDQVTYDSVAYTPAEISRQEIGYSSDERTQILEINLPASHPLPRKYINSAPGLRASATIRRVHRTDAANEVIVIFKGLVQSVGFSNDGLRARIAVVPLSGALSRPAPRFTHQGQCNHVLYDDGCTVSNSLFRYTGTVTGVVGDVLTVNGLASKGTGWANAGYVVVGGVDYRLILNHTGDNIQLLLPFFPSPLSQTVEVFAGCNHDPTDCDGKFANFINYGGFAFVPLRNIFATGIDGA